MSLLQHKPFTELKYSKKLTTGPFVYNTPLQEYINDLDEEMATVLNANIPTDEKLRLYSNLLIKYKQKYDITKLNDTAAIIAEVKNSNESNEKSMKILEEEIQKKLNKINIKKQTLTPKPAASKHKKLKIKQEYKIKKEDENQLLKKESESEEKIDFKNTEDKSNLINSEKSHMKILGNRTS